MNVRYIHKAKFNKTEKSFMDTTARAKGCTIKIYETDEGEEYALGVNADGRVMVHVGFHGVRSVFIDSVELGYLEGKTLWDILGAEAPASNQKEAKA